MNNLKVLWGVVIIVAIVSIVSFFNGRTVTQVIQNPLGAGANPYNMGPEVGWNGVNRVATQADFINASTTFVGFKNPTGASTTIANAVLKQTGVATTTAGYYCGTSYKPSGTPEKQMFTISTEVATSTSWGTFIYTASTTATFAQLTIDPNEYIVCVANTALDGSSNDAGITNANNTFAGHFWFEFLVGR